MNGVGETAVLLPFVLLQASMVVFLLRQGREDNAYRQAFYVFFIGITIVDCIVVVTKRMQYHFEPFVYSYMESPDYDQNSPRNESAYERFLVSCSDVLKHVVYVGKHYQPLGHTIVATNRFTAIASPLRHSDLWGRRTTVAGTVFVAVIATLLGVVPSVATLSLTASNDAVMDLHFWIVLQPLITAANLTVCCTISFVLNLATIVMFTLYRKSTLVQAGQKSQDLRLFAHSLFMFLVQAVLAFHAFVFATDYMGTFEHYGSPIPSWIPRSLMLWSSKWMVGKDDCSAQEAIPEIGVEYCGLLYGLLSGYLAVPGDVMVSSIVEHMFSLSATPFLLIVSGSVRRSYAHCYFSRMQRRTESKVTQVVATSTCANVATSLETRLRKS